MTDGDDATFPAGTDTNAETATAVAEPETPRLGEIADADAAGAPPDETAEGTETAEQDEERPPASPFRVTVAAMLGSAAAAWMIAGPFASVLSTAVALLSVALAGGLVLASYQQKRPTPLQLAVLPVTLLAAAGLIAAAGADPGNMLALVMESLRAGGLADPPVPFDPGWRVLVVAICAWLTVTAATTAVVFDRPRIAVLVPGGVALAALVIQPPGQELVAVIVALVFAVGGLAVGYGADLARDGVTGGTFEFRRMLRAGGLSVSLIVAMLLLGQVGFLTPEPTTSQVVPSKRPEIPPPQADRVLFTVDTKDELIPWRIGVLDVYADNAWMTPPFDSSRLADLTAAGGDVAKAVTDDLDEPGAVVTSDKTFTATFTLEDVEGRVVPLAAGVTKVAGDLPALEFDPRTQTLVVDGRQPAGTSYTITAAVPPNGKELVAAGKRTQVDEDSPLAQYVTTPPPGPVVKSILAEARGEKSPYLRLQHVRTALFKSVIAAGEGRPVDVPPAMVDQMLQGAEASPYAIVAAEVLLARWAGFPARIGYGYFGGEEGQKGVTEIRPKHGAMWLEAYFEGLGWVPIVGRPEQAASSLDNQNDDQSLTPSDNIAAQLFIPTANSTLAPLYELVRYWLIRILPLVLGVVVLLGGYPAPIKVVRRWWRRRWADKRGPKARIAVAYTDLRDTANDLNIGHPTLTPIEFLDAIEPDAEHRELAWIATRAFWGDMRRDTNDDDALAAEDIVRSLRKRLTGGQTYIARVLGAISRVSLKQPYDPELPNLWRSRHQHAPALTPAIGRARALGSHVRALIDHVRRAAERMRRLLDRTRRRLPAWLAALIPRRVPRLRLRFILPLTTVALVAAAIAVTGGVQRVDLTMPATFEVPSVPDEIDGYRFERYDPAQQAYQAVGPASLLAGGTFYGIRHEGVIVGSLQESAFKPGPRSRGEELRSGLLESLLMNPEDMVRLGGEKVYVFDVPEQTQYLWIAPDLSTFQLLVATRDLDQGDLLFTALLATQRGEKVTDLQPPDDTPPPDPRRGIR